MKIRLRPADVAALLLLLAAGLASVPWFILVFVGNPPNRSITQSALEQLTYLFSPDNSERWVFAGNAALPLLCAAIGVAYLCRVAASSQWAVVLLCLNVLLAGVAVIVSNWPIAFFVALPTLWGWRCIHVA